MRQLSIEHFVEGILGTNTYVLFFEGAKEAVVIDPAGEAQQVLAFLTQHDLTLSYVLLTHGHADHIEAVDVLRDATGAKAAVHGLDAGMLTGETENVWAFSKRFTLRPADILLQDGDELSVAGENICCLHTPGHTPGGLCYMLGEHIFTGDTLFRGSIGRTDFPHADGAVMKKSLEKIADLQGDLFVYPGHGESTRLDEERAANPFLRFRNKN